MPNRSTLLGDSDDELDEAGLIDDDGSPLFSDDGGGSDDDVIFTISEPTKPKQLNGFHYASAAANDDAGDDEYDAAYLLKMRRALEAALDEADAALFGEAVAKNARSAAAPHVIESRVWHGALGGMRVRGRACLAGAPTAAAAAADSDDDDYGDGGADESSEPAPPPITSVSQHCVLDGALAAWSVDLSLAGVPIVARVADDAALESGACEEVFASHGAFWEPIAAHHHQSTAASAEAGEGSGGGSISGRHTNKPPPSESYLRLRFGVPTIHPPLSVPDQAIDLLVTSIWRTLIVPRLSSSIPLLVAKALLLSDQDSSGGAGAAGSNNRRQHLQALHKLQQAGARRTTEVKQLMAHLRLSESACPRLTALLEQHAPSPPPSSSAPLPQPSFLRPNLLGSNEAAPTPNLMPTGAAEQQQQPVPPMGMHAAGPSGGRGGAPRVLSANAASASFARREQMGGLGGGGAAPAPTAAMRLPPLGNPAPPQRRTQSQQKSR